MQTKESYEKKDNVFFFLATFFMLFTYTNHVEATTLPEAITVIDAPTNNQGIISGNIINVKGWAVNKSGIKKCTSYY